jgi:cyclopropane-fatty-acyl-phospholipid synthase
MFPPVEILSEKLIRNRLGSVPLRIVLWNGREIPLAPQPTVTISVPKPSALRHLVRPSFMSVGEGYVEGDLQIEGPATEIIRLLDSMGKRTPSRRRPGRLWKPRRRGRRQDARAIRYHYDVSNDFYRLWLDKNLVYSCAYFRTGRESLDQAQELKLDHICRKLMLQPGERLLDIGCGWGGLIRWAARHYGVHATGITLSRRQYDLATQLIREEKLADRCQVLLCDYRDMRAPRPFDKIASVGMFEHVGLAQLERYFAAARDLLKEGGLFLNHGICSSEVDAMSTAGDSGKFIDRYVFPYSELPHLSLAAREMARADFEITDVESLRPHYVRTLGQWLDRLEANERTIEEIAGSKRYRIWRAYLAGSAHSFGRGWISVYQILGIKRSAQGGWPLPWTRDHLYNYSVYRAGPHLSEALA